MSIETLNNNKTEANKTEKTNTPENKTTGDKQMVALSVKDKSETSENKPVKLEQKSSYLLPQNRPIESSHLQIVGTYDSVGSARPIVKSDIHIKNTLAVSGQRPISASILKVSDTYSVMGNRPVASNQIDDPLVLMGYLD